MKKRIITLFTGVIIIGLTALVLNNMFGNVVNFSTQEAIPGGSGLTWYRYNVWGYLENIKNTFKNITILQIEFPLENRQWINASFDFFDQGEFWEATWNNLAVILNFIIFGMNLAIYPFRVGAYTLQITMSTIGINVIEYESNPLKWLLYVTELLCELELPLI